MLFYKSMTLIRHHLQSRDLKLFSYAQIQDNLWFIDFTSERRMCVFCTYVHSMNHTYAYLRNDRKIYFRMVSAQHFINEAPVLFSLAQVRYLLRCFCFRSGLVGFFLKTSERGDSWCTDSSFSSLLVKLSQEIESALLDSILKLAVIPVACAPFPTLILPSSQLCI